MARAESNDRIERLLADWQRERPELDVEPMAVVGRVLSLGRQLEARANEALKGFGLHYTDLDVMATLRRSGAPYALTPTALRESVLITSGAMTACLDRLERNGFIRRIDSASDRRSKAAKLTPSGKKLIDKAIVARFAEAGDALDALSESERRTLAKLLKKLDVGLQAGLKGAA